MRFTDDELSRIQAAPAAIFLLVAGADGGVSPAEHSAWAAWRASVDASGGLSPDPAYNQVWEWLLAEAPVLELPAEGRDALLARVRDASALLSQKGCPVTDAPAVKTWPSAASSGRTCSATMRPMFRQAVAAGDGALHTLTTRSCR